MNIINQPINELDNSEASVTFSEFIAIVRRRRIVIGNISITIILAGIIITLLTPPTYRATSYLLVQPTSLKLNQIDAANPLADLLAATPSYKIETQVRLLQNEAMIREIKSKLRISEKFPIEITAKAVTDTDIIEINVDSVLANTSKVFANTLMDSYLEETATFNGKSVRDALDFTKIGAEKAQKDLEIAENELRKFQQQNKVSELDKNREVKIKAAQEINDQYKILQAKISSANSQLATLKLQMLSEPQTLSAIISADADPAIHATEAQLATLNAERASLLTRYTKVNKQVAGIDAQIATLNKYLLKQRSQVSIRNEAKNPIYDAMRTRRDLLEEEISGLSAEAASTAKHLQDANLDLNSFPVWQQKMARLQRQVEIAKANYTFLSSKREDLRLRDQTKHVDARVMEYAIEPKEPIRPKKALNIILSAVLGIFAAMLFALIQEFLDDRISSQEELERIVGLPTLANIPMIGEEGLRVIKDTSMLSPIMEVYRGLRLNIKFAGVDRPIRSLLVTSTVPAEGKSTIAYNLAIALSLENKKIIIVDADLRRPSQHKIQGLSQTPGLTDVLLGNYKLEAVLQQTPINDVQLISAGLHAPNPAELLASEAMARLITELSELADILIIDSPPVLAVSDSVILATRVDGVLFVTSYRETKRGNLRHAIGLLNHARSRIIGTIMNKVDATNDKYYGYYNYNYVSINDEENSGNILSSKNENNDAIPTRKEGTENDSA